MNVRHRLWLVASLTAGCFRDPSSQIAATERAAPQTLEVNDPGGASFALDQAPRDPRLELGFAEAPPPDAEHALLLLRGVFDPMLLARFVDMRQNTGLKDRTVPLDVVRERPGLIARPSGSLSPAGRYCLAWMAGELPLSFPLSVSPAEALGARLVESWPSPGESRVAPELARLLLRFDGAVSGDLEGLVRLQAAAGPVVPTERTREPCHVRGLPDGDCLWLTPQAPLSAGTRYRLVVDQGLSAQTGAPIAPTEVAFDLAQSGGGAPPQLLGTPCALDEQETGDVCLRVEDGALFVSGGVSESALVTLSVPAQGGPSAAMLSVANTFALRLPLKSALDAALLRVTNLSGHTLERPLAFEPAADLARVSIDELRADPLGKEPTQEYVELVNFGSTPVSLMGFTLSTDVHAHGRTIAAASAQALRLAPGERVLVVASGFDPRDLSDGALAGGTRLLALDGALSLANGGARVVLRDAAGRRVSAATTFASLVEGQCSARFHSAAEDGADLRSGAASDFELDPRGSCTPGRATFPYP